jgi:histidyl-tRNA synthetase
LWDDLGLEGITLEINSLGQPEERARHRTDLVAYLEQHADRLDEDGKRRLHTNPLRILDTKNPALQEIVEAAPKLIDYLGECSLRHFEDVQQLLKDAAIPYRINPRLVRGLDYYNLTVFEWVTDALGAQGTVCAGGRYDGLVEQLGGKPAPACGFAMGIERLMALLEAQGGGIAAPVPDVYVVHQGDAAQRLAFRAAELLRDTGCAVLTHMGGGSFKSQFKRADASGAQLAVIVGDDEAAANAVTLKPLREEAEQRRVPLDQLADVVADWLYGADEDLEEE